MTQLLMRRPSLNDLPPMPAVPAGYELRELSEVDIPELVRLLNLAFNDSEWTLEKVRHSFIDDDSVHKTLVLTTGSEIVATASARIMPEAYPGSGYVHWVAVSPEHRSQHLGYIISLAVLYEFVKLGCKDAVLETDDHRLPAIRTYQKLGFEPENRHESHPERWAKIMADLMAAANL